MNQQHKLVLAVVVGIVIGATLFGAAIALPVAFHAVAFRTSATDEVGYGMMGQRQGGFDGPGMMGGQRGEFGVQDGAGCQNGGQGFDGPGMMGGQRGQYGPQDGTGICPNGVTPQTAPGTCPTCPQAPATQS